MYLILFLFLFPSCYLLDFLDLQIAALHRPIKNSGHLTKVPEIQYITIISEKEDFGK
jgi:hypothetical protein